MGRVELTHQRGFFDCFFTLLLRKKIGVKTYLKNNTLKKEDIEEVWIIIKSSPIICLTMSIFVYNLHIKKTINK